MPHVHRLWPSWSWTNTRYMALHDDVIKWKPFPRYWPFVRGIHRSPVNSPHKGQWRGALMISLICAWMNGWVNNREAGDRWIPHKKASNAEKVSIWWRRHELFVAYPPYDIVHDLTVYLWHNECQILSDLTHWGQVTLIGVSNVMVTP